MLDRTDNMIVFDIGKERFIGLLDGDHLNSDPVRLPRIARIAASAPGPLTRPVAAQGPEGAPRASAARTSAVSV